MTLRYRFACAVCRCLGLGVPPEPEVKAGRVSWRVWAQRARAWVGSYATSLAAHGVLLGVLALIVVATPQERPVAELFVRAAPRAPELSVSEVRGPALALGEPLEVEEPETMELEEPEEALERPDGEWSLEAPSLEEVPEALGVLASEASVVMRGALGERGSRRRLQQEGGSRSTVEAVEGALEWLRRHQSPDGRWDVDGWHRECGDAACGESGWDLGWRDDDEEHDVGVTSLAVLAFLGQGHSHVAGPYRRTVRLALRYLKAEQGSGGSIGVDPRWAHSIYDHALATFALAEALAVTRDFTLRRPAQAAMEWLVGAQNRGSGWRYGVRPGESDTSVTGWAVLALKACKTAGLEVPAGAFEGAEAWFEDMTDGAGITGYQTRGGSSVYFGPNRGRFADLPVNTAVSVASRLLVGRTRTRSLRPSVEQLMGSLPAWTERDVNFYYWYYGTYAMFQVGGNDWRRWNRAMQNALLPRQVEAGCAGGSWEPVGEWCLVGGRVYATAINALTLEIYYRYERARQ